MSVSIGGVIMASPPRAEWAEQLSSDLGLPIVWDKIQDRHDTGLRCLQAGIGSDASHWLIVQDDAIVALDLLAGLEQAVKVSQDRIVCLYVGNVRPEVRASTEAVKAAQREGASWMALPGPWWGVGLVIPTVHLPSLCESFAKSREQNYDRRIETWARKAKVECWYTMPSLVDHRKGDENPSLVPGRRSTARCARWFTGGSALHIDWSRGPLPLHELWRHPTTGRVQQVRRGSSQGRRLALTGYVAVVKERCGECGGPKYVEVSHGSEPVDDHARDDHPARAR